MSEDEADEVEVVDPIERALGDLDPSAMVAGFVVVVEWIEANGARTIAKLSTDMAPWHCHGLLEYGQRLQSYMAGDGDECTCGEDDED